MSIYASLVCDTFSDVRCLWWPWQIGGAWDRYSVECSSTCVCLMIFLTVRLELWVWGRKVPEVKHHSHGIKASSYYNYDLTIMTLTWSLLRRERLSDFCLFISSSSEGSHYAGHVKGMEVYSSPHEWGAHTEIIWSSSIREICLFSSTTFFLNIQLFIYISMNLQIFIPKAIIWNYNYSFSWSDWPSFAHGSSFKLTLGSIGHTRSHWNFWLFLNTSLLFNPFRLSYEVMYFLP